MKITIFAGALDASLVARILPLSKALGSFGFDCRIVTPIRWHSLLNKKAGNILSVLLTHNPKEYLKMMQTLPQVVIIGRTSTPQMYFLQRYLKWRGVKTIFDLDDALFLNDATIFGVNMRPGSFCLESIIKNSDCVTVNGDFLKKFAIAYNKNTIVIPDPIDTTLLSHKLKNKNAKFTIGWAGNPTVHYENLKILVRPLNFLSQQNDFRFKLVSYLGDKNVKEIFSSLEPSIDVDYGADSWVSFENYVKMIADFDIMVAPLTKKPWNEGKSSLRVGIAMALGIPIVASPVGEQKYVIKNGVNGFIAKTEAEWCRYLKIMIDDDILRREMGLKARETAEKELSTHISSKKLFRIIQNLN
jgi:glycosyltransferase involved in cell wall biosynthesis